MLNTVGSPTTRAACYRYSRVENKTILKSIVLILAMAISATVASRHAVARCSVDEIITAVGQHVTFIPAVSQHATPAEELQMEKNIKKELVATVGKSCSWRSDVSKCTFREVALMVMDKKESEAIYDKCSD